MYTTEGGAGYIGSTGSQSTVLPVDGSAGTLYKYESNRGPQYRELKYVVANKDSFDESDFKPQHTLMKVDGGSRPGYMTNAGFSALPTMVMDSDRNSYEFDEVQLHGTVSLMFHHPPVNIYKFFNKLFIINFYFSLLSMSQ